jgi:hypothetical protein
MTEDEHDCPLDETPDWVEYNQCYDKYEGNLWCEDEMPERLCGLFKKTHETIKILKELNLLDLTKKVS